MGYILVECVCVYSKGKGMYLYMMTMEGKTDVQGV
jgi:hypothetical protein